MVKAQSYSEVRLCEECGEPIERGRIGQLLCRRCEQSMERSKRKGQEMRQSRRDSRRSREEDDW